MTPERSSGVLLHPSSLPGADGIGDVGPAAAAFVDFLAAAGQRYWQVLPLGPAGPGNSPYSAFSTFAGNPLLVSPEALAADGYLDPAALPAATPGPVDYGRVIADKGRLLDAAFARFEAAPPAGAEAAFAAFCRRHADWLDDWALYAAQKARHGGAPWYTWEEGLVRRRPEAMARARRELARELLRERFIQFQFFTQWERVRQRAHARGVSVVGDLPIFVPMDSADVWAHPGLFKLDERLRPTVVAGVPPDYFSATGQLWGNPVYAWDAHREDGYAWWVARLRTALAQADVVRIDHFRGFAACWEVPAGEATAVHGTWAPGPGREPFDHIARELGQGLPLIAEDLGLITPDVVALRDALDLPGMVVLQFAFDGGADNPHRPENHRPRQVVYTGTHDNDTTRGWFNALDASARARVLERLGGDGGDVTERLVRMAMESVAGLAIVPLQDVLDLDGAARMNCPGVAAGNWTWRAETGALSPDVAKRLLGWSRAAGRCGG